jgi:hypothetical protein
MDGSHLTNPSMQSPEPEAAERRARHLRMLVRLADVGMELIEHVRRQVLEDEVPPGVDPVLAFASLAKAVRQTVALEAKVAAGGFSTPQPAARAVVQSEGVWRPWDGKLKAKVRLKVEEAIASLADPSDAENLLCDLNERLDDPEYGDEMSDRPVGMAFALICGALGLEVDLKKYSDAELGLDREDFKAAVRAFAEPPLVVAAGGVPGGSDDDAALPPSWPPKTDPPYQ